MSRMRTAWAAGSRRRLRTHARGEFHATSVRPVDQVLHLAFVIGIKDEIKREVMGCEPAPENPPRWRRPWGHRRRRRATAAPSLLGPTHSSGSPLMALPTKSSRASVVGRHHPGGPGRRGSGARLRAPCGRRRRHRPSWPGRSLRWPLRRRAALTSRTREHGVVPGPLRRRRACRRATLRPGRLRSASGAWSTRTRGCSARVWSRCSRRVEVRWVPVSAVTASIKPTLKAGAHDQKPRQYLAQRDVQSGLHRRRAWPPASTTTPPAETGVELLPRRPRPVERSPGQQSGCGRRHQPHRHRPVPFERGDSTRT